MKTKIFLSAMLISLAVISCKNEEKQPSEQLSPGALASAKPNFSVEIDASAEKKDDFALYYTQDNTIEFNGEQVGWQPIEGGNVQQKIVMDTPLARAHSNDARKKK